MKQLACEGERDLVFESIGKAGRDTTDAHAAVVVGTRERGVSAGCCEGALHGAHVDLKAWRLG